MQDYTASTVDNAIAMQKYGVGQPVRRKEDDTLVRLVWISGEPSRFFSGRPQVNGP
jgi:hypothetical protein